MIDPLQIGPERPQGESGAMALINTELKVFGELVAVLGEIARSFDQEDDAQDHREKPEQLAGPNADTGSP